MLVSSFQNYAWGGPDTLSRGTSWLVYTVACLPFFSLLLACRFGAVSLNPPSLFKSGQGKYWSVSIPLNSSVRVPGEGRLRGCQAYLLPQARVLPGSTNVVGINTKARLLVMTLIIIFNNYSR